MDENIRKLVPMLQLSFVYGKKQRSIAASVAATISGSALYAGRVCSAFQDPLAAGQFQANVVKGDAGLGEKLVKMTEGFCRDTWNKKSYISFKYL